MINSTTIELLLPISVKSKVKFPYVCPGLNANRPGHSLEEKIKLNIHKNGGKSKFEFSYYHYLYEYMANFLTI